MNQPTLFDPPAPPTGPQTPGNSARAGSRDAYVAWQETLDGRSAWAWIRDHAANLLRAGATRISTKALVEEARARLKVEINNTYTAYIADDLLRAEPAFEQVIERRRRKGGVGRQCGAQPSQGTGACELPHGHANGHEFTCRCRPVTA